MSYKRKKKNGRDTKSNFGTAKILKIHKDLRKMMF